MKAIVRLLASRFLTGKKQNSFLSFISSVSLFGIALGVMALIVVMSVMEGFEKELRNLITGTHSHISLYSQKNIIYNEKQLVDRIKKKFPEISAHHSYIFSEVILAHKARVLGSLIEGVKKEDLFSTTKFSQYLIQGKFPSSSETKKRVKEEKLALPGIALGKFLGEELGVKVGDTISVISPYFDKDVMQPKVKRFIVSGIISTGLYEYDSKYSLIDKKEALSFFRLPRLSATAIRIKVKDPKKSKLLVNKMKTDLGFPYIIRDWTELNHNLLYAVRLQKVVIFIILASIVIVASFNIMSTLIIMMDEKKKEMSILKALGMSFAESAQVFLLLGSIIAIMGVIFGTALALLLCKAILSTRLVNLPPDVYFISYLPLEIQSSTLWMIMLSSLFVSILASLYPSWKVARESPVYGLRYE